MSISSPWPSISRCRWVIERLVPSLHDQHWLQDSSQRNFSNMCATRTMHAVLSYAMNLPEPRPDPIDRIELKSIGVSRPDGRIIGLATPEKKPLNSRPDSGPPAQS